MTVPVSLARAKWESLARVVAASGRATPTVRSLLGRSCWMLLSLATMAGCHQQTAPGDPFLPFMRSRVSPPGTTVPPGGAPVDPYYNGTPGAAAPAGGTPAAPIVAPGAGAPAATDKYSPRGGFNVPQGSIDRSKATDFAKPNEVKASPTAIARRSLSTPVAGRTQVETQLTSAKDSAAPTDDDSTQIDSTQIDATQIDATPMGSTPAISPLAASTPLTPRPATASLAASTLAEPTLAEPTIDAAVAAFDGAGRPALAQSAKPVASAPSKNTLAAARPRAVRSDPPEPANRSTVRIVASADDAFSDADEPSAKAASDGDTRLRMTAGASRPDVSSKPIEEPPDEQPTVAAAERRPGVQFQVSEPDEGVVKALWLEPADGAADRVLTAAATAAASASDPYRYEPSYASLSGRLEYSASARQWKLRYIPIDGQTDQFGGSVLLADSTRLEGFKPGDFVSVRGAIASASQNARGFSPRYELSQIEPIP